LIVWNGPGAGVFEMPQVLPKAPLPWQKLLAESGASRVIGAADSASAVKKAGVAKQMTLSPLAAVPTDGVPGRQESARRSSFMNIIALPSSKGERVS